MPRIRSTYERSNGSAFDMAEPSTSSSASMPLAAPLAYISQGLDQFMGNARRALQADGMPWKRGSKAAQLRTALQAVDQSNWQKQLVGIVELGGLIGACSQLLSPQGPGGCDHNAFERCCNCVTSVPYVVTGVHAMRYRRTQAGRAWGLSMAGVGCASAGFHASVGKWRTLGRRLDYWSIALASNIMMRAVYPKIPASVTAAGMALTPFKPFLVSFVNSTAMEYKFLKRARENPKLRNAQRLHATTCLLGLGAFALEEFMPTLPLVHSAWHCLSACAVSNVNNLLDDVEQNELKLGNI